MDGVDPVDGSPRAVLGVVGREALDQPVAHGVGGLEADAATSSNAAARITSLTDSIARRRSVLLRFAMPFLKLRTRSSAFMLSPSLRSTGSTIWHRGYTCMSILV